MQDKQFLKNLVEELDSLHPKNKKIQLKCLKGCNYPHAVLTKDKFYDLKLGSFSFATSYIVIDDIGNDICLYTTSNKSVYNPNYFDTKEVAAAIIKYNEQNIKCSE